MNGTMRLALAFGPLAAYFFRLGLWHSAREPRVVSGPADTLWLSFGLGGLIAFGPAGEWVVTTLFPHASLAAWLALASATSLVGMFLASRSRTRAIVYHVAPEPLRLAVEAAMADIRGDTVRTVRGCEVVGGRSGVAIESTRLGSSTITAVGDEPEPLLLALLPSLRHHLRSVPTRPGIAALALFALSGAATAIPLASLLLALSRYLFSVSHPPVP